MLLLTLIVAVSATDSYASGIAIEKPTGSGKLRTRWAFDREGVQAEFTPKTNSCEKARLSKTMRKFIISGLFACLAMDAALAAEPVEGAVPDLTRGEELTRINERWVGPLGIYCGAWRPRQRSDEAKFVRQLLVRKVEEGSPADGILVAGDVILGADGSAAKEVPLFEGASWAMIPIANGTHANGVL